MSISRFLNKQEAPEFSIRCFPACQKSLQLFQTRFKNAVTFALQCAAKVQAAPVARLAMQGLARHSISFEEGFAPSSSPV